MGGAAWLALDASGIGGGTLFLCVAGLAAIAGPNGFQPLGAGSAPPLPSGPAGETLPSGPAGETLPSGPAGGTAPEDALGSIGLRAAADADGLVAFSLPEGAATEALGSTGWCP